MIIQEAVPNPPELMLDWLHRWTYEKSFCSRFQNNGASAIDSSIRDAMRHYIPKERLQLWRFFGSLSNQSSALKRFKLMSFLKNEKSALEMAEDIVWSENQFCYLATRVFDPSQILIDTTLLPGGPRRYDLIEEVIVIL